MKLSSTSLLKKLSVALAFGVCAAWSANAAVVYWTGTNGVSATTNWSDTLNWLAENTLTPTTPANNEANFNFNTMVATPGVVTINVDGGYNTPGSGLAQAWGMFFTQTNGSQTVFIQPGMELALQAAAGTPGGGNLAIDPAGTNNTQSSSGSSPPPSISYTNYTTITGIGGEFYFNSTTVRIEGQSSVVTNHYTIFDMSGLGTFIMTNTSSGNQNFYSCYQGTRSQVQVYLAHTNNIWLNSGGLFELGVEAGSSSNSLPIGLYLGQSNYISTGTGLYNMTVGASNANNVFLEFNPAFLGGPTKPTAYITGNGGNQNPVIALATNGILPCVATCDFTGGVITWTGSTLYMGVSGAGNASGNGTLKFDSGTVNFNNIIAGSQGITGVSNGAAGVGTIYVGTNATLQANTKIVLGLVLGTANGGTAGTINVNTNGILAVTSVTNGGGTGTINLTNANLNISLPVTGTTNVIVTSFNAKGTTNLINITSITPFLNSSFPIRFHLIAASSFSGTQTLGLTLPASYNPSDPYVGNLDTNTTPGVVDLVLTSGPPSARQLIWTGTNSLGAPTGSWDVATTADWETNNVGTLYNQYDLATFNDAPPGSTAVNLTTTLTPYSVTVTDATSQYVFNGSGNLSGGMALTKLGAGTLILDNTTSNNFTGGITISAGILQVGTNDSGGSLPLGSIVDNAILADGQNGTFAIGAAISGSGNVASAGGGTLQLPYANTFTGSAVATNNSTLQGGNGNSFGTGSGTVIVANGSTLDPNGAGTTKAITVSGTGVGGNGAIVNSGGTIGDSTGGLTPTLTLAGNTTLSYPNRWDLGSSTGATLSTGGNAYSLTLVSSGGNYFEWRDVRSDTNLANILISSGQLGIAGSTSVGNPAATLTITSGSYLKFYNDDGFNAAINKQVVLQDSGTIQNGAGASIMYGGLNITNANGGQYCGINVGGTSLTVNSTVTGNGILYLNGGTSPLIVNGNGSTFVGGVAGYSGTFTLNGPLGSGITNTANCTLTGTGTANGYVDVSGPVYPGAVNGIGTFNAAAGLTLEGSSTLTMDLSANTAVGGTNNDLIAVTGNVTLNNGTLIINPLPALTAGTYTLITYTGSASGSFGTVTASSRYTLNVVNNASAQAIQLIVSGSGSPNNLLWNNGSSDGQWDVQTSQNWSNLTTLQEDVFYAADNVTFNDTILSAANPQANINLAVPVGPSTVTVNNSATNYTFSGSGYISGSAAITKQGTGALVIDTANTFTGGVTVSGGLLQAGNVTAFGTPAGTVAITNGATADFNGYYVTTNHYRVSGAGINGNGAVINSGTAVFDSPGSVTSMTLTGNATFGGPNRWDLGSRTVNSTLSTGGNAYNLTLTNAAVGAYTWEWYDVTADAALNNINLGAGEWGVAGTNYLGNPAGTVTIYPTAAMVFYGGSNYLKNFLLMPAGAIIINGGSNFNFGTVTMDAGALFEANVAAQMSGPVTLAGTGIFQAAANMTFSNALSGVGGVTLSNSSATLILNGTNTYNGTTLLLSGSLELLGNGSISSSTNIVLATGTAVNASTRSDGTLTLASGQELQGLGNITGKLTGASGSTVSPGTNGTGTLTVASTATLAGNTALGVGAGSNNMLTATSVVYGGTLQLSFIPGSLSSGQTFQLFSASTYSGGFTSISPAQPGPGLEWTTGQLATSGVIGVGTIRPAGFATTTVAGSHLTLNGTNGTPYGTYRLYSSTNLLISTTNQGWTEVGTGTFNSGGNFSYGITNTNNAAQFYILEQP